MKPDEVTRPKKKKRKETPLRGLGLTGTAAVVDEDVVDGEAAVGGAALQHQRPPVVVAGRAAVQLHLAKVPIRPEGRLLLAAAHRPQVCAPMSWETPKTCRCTEEFLSGYSRTGSQRNVSQSEPTQMSYLTQPNPTSNLTLPYPT